LELKGQIDSYLFNPEDKSSLLNTKGKVGSVFLGNRKSDNISVIIKQINSSVIKSKEDLQKFTVETRLKVDHPYIVNTLEYIFEENNLYIIREYVKGIDLKQALKHRKLRKKFNVEFSIKCIIKVLECLSELHKQNIFHCDIKPSNIILAFDDIKMIDFNNPKIKLIDLGMARSLQKFNTKYGNSPFALIYSPPEQLLNANLLINASSDIFSTAITLYELIVKKPPLDNENPLMLMTMQMVYPLEKNRKIPEELFKIIAKASYKFPFSKPPHMFNAEQLTSKLKQGQEKRYKNANVFIEALSKFI